MKKLLTKYYRYYLLLGSVFVAAAFIFFLFDIKLSVNPSNFVLTKLGKTPSPEPESLSYQSLSESVIPAAGYTIPVKWGDLGQRLVKAGGINLDKYRQNYVGGEYEDELTFLTENKGDTGITITPQNSYFWVNTLWALGLTARSQVLSEGIMGTEYRQDLGNFASTGGWTLGSRDAVKLYDSTSLISLTPDQEQKVRELADNIYRPCCDNPTSFPDCNHGMAMLGVIELMVSQGFSDSDIYRAALALNSYWFPTTYVDLAYYYQLKENTAWDAVDPKTVLGKDMSSASGFNNLKKTIGTVPGTEVQGGSCGA